MTLNDGRRDLGGYFAGCRDFYSFYDEIFAFVWSLYLCLVVIIPQDFHKTSMHSALQPPPPPGNCQRSI